MIYSSVERLHDVDVLLSNNVDVNSIREDSFHRCYFRQGAASAVETWLYNARYVRHYDITKIARVCLGTTAMNKIYNLTIEYISSKYLLYS